MAHVWSFCLTQEEMLVSMPLPIRFSLVSHSSGSEMWFQASSIKVTWECSRNPISQAFLWLHYSGPCKCPGSFCDHSHRQLGSGWVPWPVSFAWAVSSNIFSYLAATVTLICLSSVAQETAVLNPWQMLFPFLTLHCGWELLNMMVNLS